MHSRGPLLPPQFGVPPDRGFSWSDQDLSRLLVGTSGDAEEAPLVAPGELGTSVVAPVGLSSMADVSTLSRATHHGRFRYVGEGVGSHILEPSFRYVGQGAGDFDFPVERPQPRTYWWLIYPAACVCCSCVLLPLVWLLFRWLLSFRVEPTPTPPPILPTPAPFPCLQDFDILSGRWLIQSVPPAEATFCCNHFDIGCFTKPGTTPPPDPTFTTTTTTYSCFDEGKCYNCIQETWSVERLKWCCAHKGVGCVTTAEAVDFDCEAGVHTWKIGWSAAKKDYCCQHEPPVGCPGFQVLTPSPTPAALPTTTTTTRPPPTNPPILCKDFSQWPDLDGDAYCGECKHLVFIGAFTSCNDYCESFGQQCFFAAEDEHGPAGQTVCSVSHEADCHTNLWKAHSEDMICGCMMPAPP